MVSGYVAIGRMSMLDVERQVLLPFTFDGKAFTGQLMLDRFDFDLGKSTGTFLVGNEVKVRVHGVLK